MATKVDFYQLSRDPVERVAVMLARKVLQTGGRLLLVSDNPGQRAAISQELWRGAGPEEFLAHGDADSAHAEQQPVLLSDQPEAANGARMILLADGQWRSQALGFDRALLLFGAEQTEAARALWRELDEAEGVTREIHKQDENGRWRAGA